MQPTEPARARGPLRVEDREGGRVALVTLAAGRGNVLTIEVLDALAAALDALATRGGALRAVVLAAEGSSFSYGASVGDHLPERMEAMLSAMRRAVTALVALPAVTIAAVRGLALGGGLEVALACDRVIAAPDATLGHPEIDLAVLAPIGSVLLPRRVGEPRALEMLLGGARKPAAEALAIGLIDAIAPDPEESALAFARAHLFAKSAAALRPALAAARLAKRRALDHDLPAAERIYRDDLMRASDPLEGLRAFLDKRTPRFTDA